CAADATRRCMPEMTRVQSSHVWEVGHEADTLYIRYWPTPKHPAGRVVRYLGVDEKTAKSVIEAPSIGSALHAMIRGKYEEASSPASPTCSDWPRPISFRRS